SNVSPVSTRTRSSAGDVAAASRRHVCAQRESFARGPAYGSSSTPAAATGSASAGDVFAGVGTGVDAQAVDAAASAAASAALDTVDARTLISAWAAENRG